MQPKVLVSPFPKLQTLIIAMRTWMKVQAVVLKKVSKLSRSKRKLTASVKSNANGAE